MQYAVQQSNTVTQRDAETNQIREHTQVSRMPAHSLEHAGDMVRNLNAMRFERREGRANYRFTYEVVCQVYISHGKPIWLTLDDIAMIAMIAAQYNDDKVAVAAE